MTKSPKNSKKQASRPKSKPGCFACKQRRFKCDGTLPICQHCESSGRICEGLGGKTLTPPRTIAPTSPAAMKATHEYGGTFTDAGAGLQGVHTEDSIVVEVFEEHISKRTADTVSRSDTEITPSTKRARRDKQQGAELSIVPTRAIGDQTTKEDKHLKLASASVTFKGGESQHTQTREGSACIDQQSSARDFNQRYSITSPNQSNNHPNDFQPSPSARSLKDPQEPSNSNIPTHDRQSLVDFLIPSELDQEPRLRNPQTADDSSQNTLTSERFHRPSEPQALGTFSTARNGQSPTVGLSFRSVTPNPDLSPPMPTQTSMQSSNHLNAEHYRESQRNESGPGDSGAFRDRGDSFVNHNQQHSSTNRINPRNSVPQWKRPDYQLRPIQQNSHTSSSGHLLQTQSTYQPPDVTFTMDNRIYTPLPIATVESLMEIFSKHCKIILRPKRIPTENTSYLVDFIMWQHSRDFYKWYMAETRTDKVSTLSIELFDANRKLEKAFSIPVSNLYYFQMLKQCIWDSFWVASELNNAPAYFNILVKPTVTVHSQSPTVTMPQSYDGSPPRTDTITRQTAFTTTSPRPNNSNTTVPPIHFQTTPFPEHSESAIQPSSSIYGSGIPVDVVTRAPHQRQPRDAPQLRNSSSQRTLTMPPLAPEISARLQMDGAGKVSDSYSKWVFRAQITSSDFFAWFACQTGRGGDEGPPSLRFTFKDAMPCPMSSTITRVNEDHFNLIKRKLRTQFDRARRYVPNLREFVVLVTDPGWVLEED